MKSLMTLMLVFVALAAGAQDVIDLWSGDPPHLKVNELEEYVEEQWGVPCLFNVTHPTLTIYPAEGENTGRAVVILPGGGYQAESFVAEGRQIANYLASKGITAAVLKYRLPLAEASEAPHLVPLSDARKAIQLLRSKAHDYSFDSAKVGIMGFSAGGHLAAAASVLPADDADGRPDFSALIYPVTTLEPENREWLEETLFHRPMTEAESEQYSLVDRVDSSTPPAFLLHSYDDAVVPVSESMRYADALTAEGLEVEVHFFARGGHGFGPGRAEDGTGQWLGLLADWIRRQ